VQIAERGREFAITRTEPGGGTIRWFFRFAPCAGGTTAILGYQVLKSVPVGLHIILRAFLGVRDLEADLRLNMTTSLGRVAEIAEREARARPGRSFRPLTCAPLGPQAPGTGQSSPGGGDVLSVSAQPLARTAIQRWARCPG
jgi:hypothetical protein